MERLTEILKSGNYVPKAPLYTMCDKLGKYEDLEELGKLIILPCAAGDTVYEVQKTRKRIQPYEIIAITIDRTGYRYYYWKLKNGKGIYSNIKGFGDSRLGIDVFFTKEEAEAALKELAGGET